MPITVSTLLHLQIIIPMFENPGSTLWVELPWGIKLPSSIELGTRSSFLSPVFDNIFKKLVIAQKMLLGLNLKKAYIGSHKLWHLVLS